MSAMRHASVAIGITVLSVASAGVTSAQRDAAGESPRPTPLPKAMQTLDTWVITRFREAHLLPDVFCAVAENLSSRGVVGRFSTFLEHVKTLKTGVDYRTPAEAGELT